MPKRYFSRRGRTSLSKADKRKISKMIRTKLDADIEDKQAMPYNKASVASVPVGGQHYLLNAMAQGVDEGQRIGNQIHINGFNIQLDLRVLDHLSRMCRVIIVWDKQPNGAVFPNNALFNETGLGASEPFFSVYNVNYKERFRILYDKRVAVNNVQGSEQPVAGGTGGGGLPSFPYKLLSISKRLKRPLVTTYNSNTSSITTIQTGSLYMVLYPDANAAGTAVTPTVTASLLYQDA